MKWLHDEGYTDCFLVPGGNAMYLIDAAQDRFRCVPFVHEVGAAIAAEYFNESEPQKRKAFVLVTAGPAVTNITTAINSAWVDSRELLVIAGQANSFDLAPAGSRQRGFQEADPVRLLEPITKCSARVEPNIGGDDFLRKIRLGTAPRKGPVFLEVCLDHSRTEVSQSGPGDSKSTNADKPTHFKTSTDFTDQHVAEVVEMLTASQRPLVLLGGQVSRAEARTLLPLLGLLRIPLAATLNGFDRVPGEYEFYCGVPSWYGSRWANAIVQQADLVLALGTRLGVLETGYNWQGYAPLAKIVRVDVDSDGMSSGRPKVFLDVTGNPREFASAVFSQISSDETENWNEWRDTVANIRRGLEGVDPANRAGDDFVEFMSLVGKIAQESLPDDAIIPSSSGGAWEGTMRSYTPKEGQIIISSKGLASMGYGLSGAIGVSLAHPSRRVILIEGDGGFAQNYQELGTLVAQSATIKIFLIDNQGQASIRANQKANFNGRTVGCDADCGLGLPNWADIARAYGIHPFLLTRETIESDEFSLAMSSQRTEFFIVRCDPNQINFPRISTTVDDRGLATSNPLHEMTPPLTMELRSKYLPHLSPSREE